MYTARIVVLTTGAGGVAAYLARGFDAKSLQTEPVETTDQFAMRGVDLVRHGVQRSMTRQK
jgi:hypothetical protein